MGAKTVIPVGTRFGRLVIEGPPVYVDCGIAKRGKYTYTRKRKFYPCVCDCGKRKNIESSRIISGNTSSCGCKRAEMYENSRKNNTHYRSWATPLFAVWRGMVRRCYSSKAPNRKYYFERGIEVYPTWRDSFSDFEKWSLENGYEKGLQIDRIDVNGNYEPGNCRWVTPKVNAHNRRYHLEVDYNGKMMRLVDVIDRSGCKIDTRTVYKRIVQHGWSVERALSEPKHYRNRKGKVVVEYNGQKLTTKDIAMMAGLNVTTVRNRLFNRKMTVEQVMFEPKMTHKERSTGS